MSTSSIRLASAAPAASPAAVDPVPWKKLHAWGDETTSFLSYCWLLDPAKRVIGYRLAWRDGLRFNSQLNALVEAISSHFMTPEGGWRMGTAVLLLDVTPATLPTVGWQALPANKVVLCCREEHLHDPEMQQRLIALRSIGFGVMLCGASALPAEGRIRELLTHFDVDVGDPALIRSLEGKPVRLIATRMDDWSGFEACAASHVPVLVRPSQELAAQGGSFRSVQPESVLIVRVMQMLQRNEDVRAIEAALKHDAALTYRLLRHINSPAIGVGVQIDSLRHAVAMLGYAPLFRWLATLLATSNEKANPSFLMKQAITRGRMVELLGQVLLGPRHADNLFLAGMFSLIDRLLGVPLPELLEAISLSDGVRMSILQPRSGMYGPLLKLALTCETDSSEASRLAEELFISASQVNTALVSALVWTHEVLDKSASP